MATLGIFTLAHDTARTRAAEAILRAPHGARVKIEEPARTLDQNALLWPLLTDIARQKQHAGQNLSPDEWKALFMHACGRELRFMPALDGKGFVPFGMRSSKLTKREFSELIEFILSWGAQNGVTFMMDKERAA